MNHRMNMLRDTTKPLGYAFTRDDVWVLVTVAENGGATPTDASALLRMLKARFILKRKGKSALYLTAKGRRALVDIVERVRDEKKRRAGYDA